MKDNKLNIDSLSKSEFTDLAWSEMHDILDKEMPLEKKRRKFIFWIWPVAALFVALGISYVFFPKPVGDEMEMRSTQHTNIVAAEEKIYLEDKEKANANSMEELDNYTLKPTSTAQEEQAKIIKEKLVGQSNTTQVNQGNTSQVNQVKIAQGNKQKTSRKSTVEQESYTVPNSFFYEKKNSISPSTESQNIVVKPAVFQAPIKESRGVAALDKVEWTLAQIPLKNSLIEEEETAEDANVLIPISPIPNKLKWGLDSRLYGGIPLGGRTEIGAGLGFFIGKGRWKLRNELSYGLFFPTVEVSGNNEDATYFPDIPSNIIKTKRIDLLKNALVGNYLVNRQLAIYLGPSVSYLLNSKVEETEVDYTVTNQIDFMVSNYTVPIKEFEYSAVAGLHFFHQKRVSFDIRYQQGLSDFRLDNSKLNYQLQLGVVVKLR